jgi:hypothetical protein
LLLLSPTHPGGQKKKELVPLPRTSFCQSCTISFP